MSDNVNSIQDVRLEVGDIVAYKNGSGIFSKFVSFFTRSKYTHVAMMISDKLMIEANWYKKSNTKIFVFKEHEVEIYRFKGGLSSDQKLILLEHGYSFLNKQYDYPQIVGYIFKFFGKKDINFFNSNKRLICSELIDRAYLKIGVDLSSQHYVGDVTPKDIVNSDFLERIL